MDLSRRYFLKAGVGVSGVAGPFLLGHQLGRQGGAPLEASVSRAASQASRRLGGEGGARPEQGGPTTTTGGPAECDVEIERGTVSEEAVQRALEAHRRSRPLAYDRYRLDETLQVTDRETTRTLLACDRTDWDEYTTDFYDCEEFAMTLRMHFVDRWGLNCVGIVYDESASPIPHVYNIVFYDDASFDLVEPQTDDVVVAGADDRYAFEDVAILI